MKIEMTRCSLLLCLWAAACSEKPASTSVRTDAGSSMALPGEADAEAAADANAPASTMPDASTGLPDPTQAGEIAVQLLLGRPTDHSATVNALFDSDVEAYVEAGEASGTYTVKTEPTAVRRGVPLEEVLGSFSADTRVYYRVRARPAQTDESFAATPEYAFHTQRAQGSAFTFVVQADPHLDDQSDHDVYARTLENVLADEPDFLIDLGDTSMVDKCVSEGANECTLRRAASYDEVDARNRLQRSWFAKIAHSTPVFLVLGNHDGESGWLQQGATDSLPYWDLTARLLYYPNPAPDAFYTGSSTPDPNVGLRENFYAFTWGDVLFVMLDPFSYTTARTDGWSWTLGDEQYTWLTKTLTESQAKYKVVSAHHLVGGNYPDARGGVEFSHLYEWGGENEDGSPGFSQHRPGWAKPIHQLLVDTHVSAFLHGHDHFYAHQVRDGVVYQEVPQPSHPTLDLVPKQAAEYGYTEGDIRAASGHLRFSVGASSMRVQYVRSYRQADENATRSNGVVEHEYEVAPH